jgi:predicted GIY-YIG superfamily endonuclease
MRKGAQLFCQHLEKVSRTALARHRDVIRQYVRRRNGLYALYRRGRLYYVGLTRDLRRRLGQHLDDRHGGSWDQFSVYLTIGDGHLRELEAFVLRTIKPAGNKQKGKFVKSEDLRRRFRRDVKERQMAELNDIFAERRSRSSDRRSPKRDKTRGGVLADFSPMPRKLRARYKGGTVTARVRRDGSIRFGERVFMSPSLAAAAACGRRSCNGWTFWRYERAPGDWVLLDTLRR